MLDMFFQALIMSFREGLEAFLIIGILLKFLEKTKNLHLKNTVWKGAGVGVFASAFLGVILYILAKYLGGTSATGKLWESIASFVAVLLISTLIIHMIRSSAKIHEHITKKAQLNLSTTGIFVLSFFLIAREGVEMVLFTFAGNYSLLPLVLGVLSSLIFAILIHRSLVRVKLKTLFIITLAFLILQAGFLLGYSVHEGLGAAKTLEYMSVDNVLFTKAFDLSDTLLYHKEGILGVPLFILVGWYSSPEWIQFLLQYLFTLALFGYWYLYNKRSAHKTRKA